MAIPRGERLQMFYRRLKDAPAASTFQEAFEQLAEVLNGVEDEFSEVPFNPETWASDGRLYPPQMDSEIKADPHQRGVRVFRSRHHRTYFGANGSIEIRLKDVTQFSKPGADGKEVRDL